MSRPSRHSFSTRIAVAITFLACAVGVLLGLSTPTALHAEESEIRRFKTPGGVEYGVWGAAQEKPTPILFILAGSIDSTLEKPYFRQCGNQLAEHGFLCVSLDIPCHGTLWKKGVSGLSGWAVLANQEHDFVKENNARMSAVLDHLLETKAADPKNIVAAGTSRGGYLALQFMASEPRVKCAAAFAPVTDLAALNEFQAIKDKPFVEQINVSQQADRLAGRPVWLVIGDQDKRVGTEVVVACSESLVEASKKKGVPSKVRMLVLPEPRGHTTPKGSAERAAKWILEQQ